MKAKVSFNSAFGYRKTLPCFLLFFLIYFSNGFTELVNCIVSQFLLYIVDSV